MVTLLLVSAGLVVVSVIFHGLALQLFTFRFFRKERIGFSRISLFIFCVVLAHLLEIFLFTLAYALLVVHPDFGSLAGVEHPTWGDLYYFSAVTYTTTGYGDLTPVGNLRLLATVEALTGMVMIAWTASLAFLVMRKYWESQNLFGKQDASPTSLEKP